MNWTFTHNSKTFFFSSSNASTSHFNSSFSFSIWLICCRNILNSKSVFYCNTEILFLAISLSVKNIISSLHSSTIFNKITANFGNSCFLFYINNIFCTKIASRFARTYTDSHSLKALVSEILKVDLRKEQQCSYWGADELTDAQKGYAANDVLYLHRLRDALTDMLKKSGRYEIACKYFAFVDNVCTSDIMGFEEDLFRCKDEKQH